MEPVKVKKFLYQMLAGIADCHAKRIIHRDLKPANLFVTKRANGSPCVKVLDFGISKQVNPDEAANSMTRTTAIMGSPYYMSPEQMRSSKNVDHRTDIWALGVILYQLSTGRVPFPGETITEVCSGVLADEPASLTVIAHIPAAFDGIVRRCLQKNPTSRFANARELASALAAVAGASPGTSGLNLQVASALPGQPARPGTMAMDGPPPQLAQALSRSQGGQVAQSGQTQTEWGRPVAPPQKKSSAGLVIGLLGLALVGGGIGAFVFMQKGKAPEPAAATAKETASEPATAQPVETATAKPAFGDGPGTSATPTNSATLAASAPVSAEPTAKPTATAVATATTKVVSKATPTAKATAVATSKPVATARPTVGGGIF